MDDLIAFLHAQLDKDKTAAKRAAEFYGPDWRIADDDRAVGEHDGEVVFGEHAEHIARHDPASVLRRVAADRRIIERYQEQAAKQGENAMEEDRAWTLAPVLAELAVPYAGRPGYKEKWRP